MWEDLRELLLGAYDEDLPPVLSTVEFVDKHVTVGSVVERHHCTSVENLDVQHCVLRDATGEQQFSLDLTPAHAHRKVQQVHGEGLSAH
jgi:hypothetical protein